MKKGIDNDEIEDEDSLCSSELWNYILSKAFKLYHDKDMAITNRAVDSLLYRFMLFFNTNAQTALSLHVNRVFGTSEVFQLWFPPDCATIISSGPILFKSLDMNFASWMNYNIIHAKCLEKLKRRGLAARDSFNIFHDQLAQGSPLYWLGTAVECLPRFSVKLISSWHVLHIRPMPPY